MTANLPDQTAHVVHQWLDTHLQSGDPAQIQARFCATWPAAREIMEKGAEAAAAALDPKVAMGAKAALAAISLVDAVYKQRCTGSV